MTKRTVLMIDDEPVIQELVAEVLDDYVVLAAYTVGQARELVASGAHFDAALVDKNLPDGSGVDLVPWLRRERPGAEIVMITAYPSIDSALEVVSLGASDYLIKPMRDISELRLRVGNACDRAQQRRARERLLVELRESEERYRGLFDASPDAVLLIDSSSREIVAANAAAERLYGRSQAELARRRVDELVAPTPAPVVVDGIVRRHDLAANGACVPVEVSSASALHGGRDHVIEIVRDVSGRQRAEAERQELEKRLARNGRLEALGRMAAGIAHDVNNLLCAIRMNNEMALDAVRPGQEGREDLQQIEEAVRSAADLTRRLLNFSGRQLVREQVLDLSAVVHNVVRMLQRTLEARVKLVVDSSPAPLYVRIDLGQLEQVIANLAVNARDAMPNGGSLYITTRLRGEYAVLSMRDTGTGIPPELLSEIFEPFFSTKGNQGTGLGLATVREIVSRAGGEIVVHSKPNEGTEFVISLPRSLEDPVMASASVQVPIVGGRGETILLVEDDTAVRVGTRRMLGRAGYAVLEADCGRAALAIAQQRAIDMAILDVDLPDVSGLDLANSLLAKRSDMRVLYASGMASDPGARNGAMFLAKPYTSEDLLRSVRRTLDRT